MRKLLLFLIVLLFLPFQLKAQAEDGSGDITIITAGPGLSGGNDDTLPDIITIDGYYDDFPAPILDLKQGGWGIGGEKYPYQDGWRVSELWGLYNIKFQKYFEKPELICEEVDSVIHFNFNNPFDASKYIIHPDSLWKLLGMDSLSYSTIQVCDTTYLPDGLESKSKGGGYMMESERDLIWIPIETYWVQKYKRVIICRDSVVVRGK